MKERGKTVNLYAYLDYRAFLRDWYEAAKHSGKAFSFRGLLETRGLPFSELLQAGDGRFAGI
jgi:hypothetical protein